MSKSRTIQGICAAAALFLLAFLMPTDTFSQQKKDPKKAKAPPSLKTAEEVLKHVPRPKQDPLPPSKLPLEFVKGERIALVGSSLAERMNLFGSFETMLHLRFPDKQLVIRNFGRPADEVGIRQRSNDYTRLDDPLYAFNPDTFLCFFGYNESFAGPAGVEKYKAEYEKFLDEFTSKYPRDDAKSPPRFVLISPIAFEFTGDPLLPEGTKENENLKLYTAATKAVAEKRKLAFVDLFTGTFKTFSTDRGMHSTINGAHLNKNGDLMVGLMLDLQLFGSENPNAKNTEQLEKLRKAVVDKSWVHHQDHRMVNGWYVYGGRRTFDTETFPLEYKKIRNMAAVRDQYIWDIASGKPVADKVDDSKTGELFVPPTRFGSPGQKYSEAETLRYLPPDEFIKTCTVPPGMEIKLFADESMFPELAKPVQLNFDNKGRLWVSCMPTYPQWRPGDGPAHDKLLILEDTDGDGKADKCTTFYDRLQCPTGFEFFNGGVLVVDQPRMIWLKDTNGDDKADQIVHVLDGWATDDTHHTCGAFEWSHTGKLHCLEGIATSTTLETPWGAHRSMGTGGAYAVDPRTWKVKQFALPGMANMWCYHFDEWGNGFPGDGTTQNMAWDTPLSGAQYGGRKGLNFLFQGRGERPNIGSERLVSRNLPDDVQGQFIYASVITMNGMPRFSINDDGAGFRGERIKDEKGFSDLIRSTDKHFRPSDPQIGPDGALWFGDWANALIGHMQYSQRDPNRDHVRGRIYRLVGKDKPLVKPVTQYGKTVAEILEQFREYEWRTRYRARRELHDRAASEVLPVVKEWSKKIEAMPDDNDPLKARLMCEALWIQAGHHAVDVDLLKKVLKSPVFNARAAAVHILSEESDRIPDSLTILKSLATDTHPRVRTEVARALSLFPTADSMAAVMEIAKLPMDYWTRYTVECALGANEPAWRQGFLTGTLTKGNPVGEKMLNDVIANSKLGGAAAPFLRMLLSSDPLPQEGKNKAITALAGLRGNPSKGREVFVRSCTACHKVGNGEGQEYGPNMAGVMTRSKSSRYKLVESIIDPNAEVDMKYLSTKIDTIDGKTISGLVVAETPKEVTIFDGKEKKVIPVADIEKRTTLKQSSMPEGLAGTMAPSEFLDLVDYLATLVETGDKK